MTDSQDFQTNTQNHPLVSVVLPCFNVSAKVEACLKSLDGLKDEIGSIEIIFVDDLSTDSTFVRLAEYTESRPWARLLQLSENSGSPSRPRNVGLNEAKGDFVFFLDPDDEILPAGIQSSLSKAHKTGADLVRAPLVRDDGRERIVMNRIPEWNQITDRRQRLTEFVRVMSTVPPTLYRRKFLIENDITWPTDLRLAEDAVFLYSALVRAKVEYSDVPDYVYHAEIDEFASSSTQQYQAREMHNHAVAWARSAEILAQAGIDFFEVRGQISLQSALQNMIKFNRGGFPSEVFDEFCSVLQKHAKKVRSYHYSRRFGELRDYLLDGDQEAFEQSIKLRLLIAGYDLRFILPSVEKLSEHYSIKIDEWTGHDEHDENQSLRLLNWADVIHCEWMLGNAVWYSQHKQDWQSLVVRLHRFETDRPYGKQLDSKKVDLFITIAPAVLEEMQRNFNFPREKVVFIPNYIEIGAYRRIDDPEKVFNLAMVGSIPSRKGYRRALELLRLLREVDQRYTLTVYGKKPEELSWVIGNPRERSYFEECELFIRMNGLESSVKFEGWVNTKEALADKGFILSLSDAEGSHVAAAEGFAAGNMAIFHPWEGVEFLYPSRYIFDGITQLRNFVLENRDYEKFKLAASTGGEYVARAYSLQRFFELYTRYVPKPQRVSYQ